MLHSDGGATNRIGRLVIADTLRHLSAENPSTRFKHQNFAHRLGVVIANEALGYDGGEVGVRKKSPSRAERKEAQNRVASAALRLMEQLRNERAVDISFPDEHNRNSPEVDLTARLGAERFAFEHTWVEEFQGSLRVRNFVIGSGQAKFAALTAALKRRLPGGDYEVDIRGLSPDISAKSFDAFIHAVEQGIPAAFADPSALRFHAPHYHWRARPLSGLNADVHVQYTPSLSSQAVDVRMTIYGPPEHASRVAVVERAFAEKLPKLKAYKDRGATTVLVLQDVALSLVLPPAIDVAIRLMSDPPYASGIDYAIVVSTEPDIWSLQIVRPYVLRTNENIFDDWYLFDPPSQFIHKYDAYAEGSRGQLWKAMDAAGVERSDDVVDVSF